MMNKFISKRYGRMSFMVLPPLGVAIILFSSFVFDKVDFIENGNNLLPITLKLQQIAENIQAPTAMAFPDNGDIWITEQTGKIRVLKNGKLSNEVRSSLTPIRNMPVATLAMIHTAEKPKIGLEKIGAKPSAPP